MPSSPFPTPHAARQTAIGAALLLAIFELASVWFVMPLPGSQRIRSLELAYALHASRWVVRAVLAAAWGAGIVRGVAGAGRWGWGIAGATAVAAAVAGMVHTQMAADRIFLPPTVVRMATLAENAIADDRLVVGVAQGDEARAYPLQAIGYHHQVRDSLAGQPILVTYCTVCRTGRVFVPVVDGVPETFRLVGMDRFNAMLEDSRTGSWWRQANGEAVAGPKRGTLLEEIPSRQMTLRQWRLLHPGTRVMQLDPAFADRYDRSYAYERGTSRTRLTGTDPRPWQEKSWVVGVAVRGAARAYDWGMLVRERVIHDTLGGRPIVIAVAADSASFAAFVRPDTAWRAAMVGDSLVAGGGRWALSGRGIGAPLEALAASQEYWHSWRTFQPTTTRFRAAGEPAP
jgi:hypothetical protein